MYPRKWVRNGLQWHLLRLSFLIVHGPDAWKDRGDHERWNGWWFNPQKLVVLPCFTHKKKGFTHRNAMKCWGWTSKHCDFTSISRNKLPSLGFQQKGRLNQKERKFDIIQLYPTIGICWGFGKIPSGFDGKHEVLIHWNWGYPMFKQT